MKYTLIALFVITVTLTAKAQAADPAWMNTPTGAMVQAARKATKQVSIQELKTALDKDEDLTVLDVRTPKEYEAAHIADAVNAPRGLLEFSIWKLVPNKNEKLYVVCKSGARAALATQRLQQLGYTNAVSVQTGMTDWTQAGYPVQTSISDEQVVLVPVRKN